MTREKLKAIWDDVGVALVTCAVTIFLSVYLGMYLVGFISALIVGDNYKVDSTWFTTIGTMGNPAFESSSADMHYHYNNKCYEQGTYSGVDVYGAIRGDRFVIKVNPKKPENYVVIGWKPIFSDDEETAMAKCRIEKVWGDESDRRKDDSEASFIKVVFSYTVSGVEYERSQWVPPSYTSAKNILKKGDIFEIRYLVASPQRAIIQWDKQLKE